MATNYCFTSPDQSNIQQNSSGTLTETQIKNSTLLIFCFESNNAWGYTWIGVCWPGEIPALPATPTSASLVSHIGGIYRVKEKPLAPGSREAKPLPPK